MNTTENNKIIAEFMGYEWFEVNKPYIAVKNVNGSVHFRTDWNDLMEVVEKIYSLNIYYDEYIFFNSSMFSSGKIELSTNKEAVYNACVEFIQWYNENK